MNVLAQRDYCMPSQLYPQTQHRQEIEQFSLSKKWLIPWIKLLPPDCSLSKKLTRIAYGKQLKHMRNAGPKLELRPNKDCWDIFWNGKQLASTLPLPKPTRPKNSLWIMATGPSLNSHALTELQQQDILGLNGAIASCLENNLTPKYYAITDRDFFENRMHLVVAAVSSGAHCLFSFNGIARICEHAPELLKSAKISLLETVNRYYMAPQITESALRTMLSGHPKLVLPSENDVKSGWSHDIQSGVFTANTIAFIGCQIANSLHYEHAYILGMDLGSVQGSPSRSYESGKDARPTTIGKDYDQYILPSFELLNKTKTNTQFWNISPSSRLPDSVMPRKSFESALAEAQFNS